MLFNNQIRKDSIVEIVVGGCPTLTPISMDRKEYRVETRFFVWALLTVGLLAYAPVIFNWANASVALALSGTVAAMFATGYASSHFIFNSIVPEVAVFCPPFYVLTAIVLWLIKAPSSL